MERLRVDKWLWAARFFRTRSLAKRAIEGGKVQLEGQRIKVSREVCAGDRLRVRRGWEEMEVIVQALTDERRGAPEAQTLYRETPESAARRAAAGDARRAASGAQPRPGGRPDRRERRELQRLRHRSESEP